MGTRQRGVRDQLKTRDQGIAMFSVLAVSAIASSLAAVAVMSSIGSLNRADRNETNERTLHLAEAGLSRAIAALEANPMYTTTQSVPPKPPTKEWILQRASTSPVETALEGQYAWVVPAGSDLAFGVGYIPSRAAATSTRVVGIGADVGYPLGGLALATRSSLAVTGNPELAGDAPETHGGGVHTNSDLSVSGSAEIGGDATATGAFSVVGTPNITGRQGGGFPPAALPPADPRSYRNRADYDLCPDATVRTVVITYPCTGTVVGSGLVGFNGWKVSGGLWDHPGNVAFNATYYVYHGNAKITGSPNNWTTSLLVEGQVLNGVLLNGDLEIAGSPNITAKIPGIAIVISRDMRFTGGGTTRGVVHVGEHVRISGDPHIHGQVVATATADTIGSPVSSNTVSGRPRIYSYSQSPIQEMGVKTAGWKEF